MEGSVSEDESLPHILLAVDQFPRTLGGGERVALRLAGLLPRYGYRVSILTLGIDPESSLLSGSAPCPLYLLPLQRTYGGEALTGAIALRRFLRQQKVRLVQTFFESSDLWVGPIAKLMSPAKLIWSRRDMGILRGTKHKVAYRLMARLPDKVFGVSEQVTRYCVEVDHIPPKRVETLYNGLDLAEWLQMPERERTSEAQTIVTVGNIRRVKGHDVFVRAAAVLAREFPNARFVVGGEVLDPAYYEELQALVRDLQLGDRFTFAGGISDLRAFLRDADLFVLPSRSEGFSNAIVEAMAAALPVVATDVGGNAEAVLDGVTGRIVPPEDSEALAAGIREVLADAERAKTMGQAGRQRVAERFTTEAMMRQLTAAYQSVLR
jgi:glycosyltransferase involved in cell wall biosynthesis